MSLRSDREKRLRLKQEIKLLNKAIELMIKEFPPSKCPSKNNDKCRKCKYYPISQSLFYDQREKSNECWIEYFISKARDYVKDSDWLTLTNWIYLLRTEHDILNAAFDKQIAESSGKNIDDPEVQDLKEILINQVKEEGK